MTLEQANELTNFIERFSTSKELYTIQTEPLTMMPYAYGEEIDDFVAFCYKNQLVLPDYNEITAELTKYNTNKGWLKTLSLHQLLQCLSFFIRQDRFVDGFLGSKIKDGTITNILLQIKENFQL
jgi:hypothetical protein